MLSLFVFERKFPAKRDGKYDSSHEDTEGTTLSYAYIGSSIHPKMPCIARDAGFDSLRWSESYSLRALRRFLQSVNVVETLLRPQNELAKCMSFSWIHILQRVLILARSPYDGHSPCSQNISRLMGYRSSGANAPA